MSRVKWKEAFYNEEPAIIDDTSSQDSVRIRKDIEYVQGDGQFTQIFPGMGLITPTRLYFVTPRSSVSVSNTS